ncbi:unnamed protein product [Clavelina lepadiformis]|uniref:NAD(P)-binding domain-containing protein n=1 Tax=Clavelina lepadiformis TaxID=159417 RepID=A0ABP0G8P3_CLALP
MQIRLFVIGATGATGLAVLLRALRHEDIKVTAFIRDELKLTEDIKGKVQAITGDIMDVECLMKAMKDHDAVVSCLGNSGIGSTTVFSEGTVNIIEAMRANNIKYLNFCGGAYYLGHRRSFSPLKLVMPVINDVEKMLQYVKKIDDITWVATMPPSITDDDFTGDYKVEVDRMPGPNKVTKHDLADWLVISVTDQSKMEEYKHQFVGISSIRLAECILL